MKRDPNRRFQSLLLISVLLLITGCATTNQVSKRIVTPPNQQSIFPAKRIAELWKTTLSKKEDPFHYFRVPVGPPEAELAGVYLSPATYEVETSARYEEIRGEKVLDFRFHYLNAGEANPLPKRGTIILLHGYMSCKEVVYPWAFILAKAGYQVVALDLRGHGHSSGDLFTFGKNEVPDLIQALDKLISKGICEGPIGVLGVSLGADLALHWMAEDERIGTVVAIAPYNDLGQTFHRFVKAMKLPISSRVVNKALKKTSATHDIQWDGLSGQAAIQELNRPVFIIGGSDDSISPPADIAELKGMAPAGSSSLIVSGVNHDLLPFAFDELVDPVKEWFDCFSL